MAAPSLEVAGTTPVSERHEDEDTIEPCVVSSSFTPIKNHMAQSIDTILCAGKCVFVVVAVIYRTTSIGIFFLTT